MILYQNVYLKLEPCKISATSQMANNGCVLLWLRLLECNEIKPMVISVLINNDLHASLLWLYNVNVTEMHFIQSYPQNPKRRETYGDHVFAINQWLSEIGVRIVVAVVEYK